MASYEPSRSGLSGMDQLGAALGEFLACLCGANIEEPTYLSHCDTGINSAQWVLRCKGLTLKLCTYPYLHETMVHCRSAYLITYLVIHVVECFLKW